MARVLLTGGTGLLGKALWREFSGGDEVLVISRRWDPAIPKQNWRKADLRDAKSLGKIVRRFKPQLVLHAAAIPNIDYCERNPAEAFAVNAQGTLNLIQSLPRRDIPFVYISTDNVFDGQKKTGYREDDLPNPVNVYGLSKLWGEHYVRELCRKFYIIRTCWLFGDGPNFVTKLLAGENLKAADDWWANPTYIVDLAEAIRALLNRRAKPGVYHLVNSRPVTRWQVVGKLKKLAVRFKIGASRTTLRRMPLAAKRPQYSILNNTAWRRRGLKLTRSWDEALKEYLASKNA